MQTLVDASQYHWTVSEVTNAAVLVGPVPVPRSWDDLQSNWRTFGYWLRLVPRRLKHQVEPPGIAGIAAAPLT